MEKSPTLLKRWAHTGLYPGSKTVNKNSDPVRRVMTAGQTKYSHQGDQGSESWIVSCTFKGYRFVGSSPTGVIILHLV